MDRNGNLLTQYREFTSLLANGNWQAASLESDDCKSLFDRTWSELYQEIKDKPQETPQAAHKLISGQPKITALTLAMARCDSKELFDRFKRLLEYIAHKTDMLSGYSAVRGVPHLQAGFLYMTAAAVAVYQESWSVLEKILTTKFEWYFHSGRPRFNYGFDLPHFFHSETLGRDAAKVHDMFREEFAAPEILEVTGLHGEEALKAYLQAQMLMSLKAAQLNLQGEGVNIWPDFGRFYAERVTPLLDRAYADRTFAAGLCRAFNEDPNTFFQHLNERLHFIASALFRGSPYLYASISEWEPQLAS